VPPRPTAGVAGRDSASDVTRALQFREFLRAANLEEVICQALGSLFGTSLPSSGCTGRVSNDKKTVLYQITATDSAGKTYEIELLGQSAELALNASKWVERHRFYVAFGFDAELVPYVTVFDFEAMVRTTPDLLPVNDSLFEYISRDNDSLLRAFLERVKGSISEATQAKFEKRLAGTR
jgi:hypothetical protein